MANDESVKFCDEGELVWMDRDRLGSVPTPETDSFIYDRILSGTHFAFSAVYDQEHVLSQIVDEITGEVLYQLRGDLNS